MSGLVDDYGQKWKPQDGWRCHDCGERLKGSDWTPRVRYHLHTGASILVNVCSPCAKLGDLMKIDNEP